jgi:hypothetical protein
MVAPKQELELTWIGKENRPRLEPRRLLGIARSGQKHSKALQTQRNDKRRSLFEAQDKAQQREKLIANIEGNRSEALFKPSSLSARNWLQKTRCPSLQPTR